MKVTRILAGNVLNTISEYSRVYHVYSPRDKISVDSLSATDFHRLSMKSLPKKNFIWKISYDRSAELEIIPSDPSLSQSRKFDYGLNVGTRCDIRTVTSEYVAILFEQPI